MRKFLTTIIAVFLLGVMANAANQVSAVPYSFTSPMDVSFTHTAGALPKKGPIQLAQVYWLAPANAGDSFTVVDGLGTTLVSFTATAATVSQGYYLFTFAPSRTVSDFRVTSLSSGTLYIYPGSTNVVPGSTRVMTGSGLPTSCNTGDVFVRAGTVSPGLYYALSDGTPCVWDGPVASQYMVSDYKVGQSSDVPLTSLITSATAGKYVASCYIRLTQSATTSSTLPNCNIQYTDPTDNLTVAQTPFGTYALNSIYVARSGVAFFDAKPGTSIGYYTAGYASSGATPMKFKIVITLAKMGQ